MKPRCPVPFILLLTIVPITVFLPLTAFAQVTPPMTVTITPAYVITSLIGVLIGYLATAYNTGKVFGQVTVPVPWLPWVGIALTFTQAFAVSLGTQPTGATALVGLIAGLLAIAGNAGGTGIHMMTTAHLSARGLAAMTAGAAKKKAAAASSVAAVTDAANGGKS